MIIADVTGKGVPAAMFMALSRTIIRAQSMTGCNPAAVLEQTNRVIVQDYRSGLFLSSFYAILDTRSLQEQTGASSITEVSVLEEELQVLTAPLLIEHYETRFIKLRY